MLNLSSIGLKTKIIVKPQHLKIQIINLATPKLKPKPNKKTNLPHDLKTNFPLKTPQRPEIKENNIQPIIIKQSKRVIDET